MMKPQNMILTKTSNSHNIYCLIPFTEISKIVKIKCVIYGGYVNIVKTPKERTNKNLGERQIGSFKYVGSVLFLKLVGGCLDVHLKKFYSLKVYINVLSPVCFTLDFYLKKPLNNGRVNVQ